MDPRVATAFAWASCASADRIVLDAGMPRRYATPMGGPPRSTQGSGDEAPDVSSRDAEAEDADRRRADRVDVTWSVDCEAEDTFLYASIANISAMGIFVRTELPLEPGTAVQLRFAPGATSAGQVGTAAQRGRGSRGHPWGGA